MLATELPSQRSRTATSQTQPLVGIVVLNWRRPADTIACVASLRRMAYPSYRVLVVDNASGDDSVERIQGVYPDLEIVETDRNLGFAGGNNVGIDVLMRAGCDYIMLLNDDAEVAEDTLARLVAVAESDPRIGFVGPTICYFDQPRIIWSAGGTVTPHGEPSQPDDGAEIGPPGGAPRDVDYVTGCAILACRDLIERIGVMDERFFLYFEETEWCARARQTGYRVVHVPDAVMWHKLTPTVRALSKPYLYLMARNRLLYLRCAGAGPRAMLAAVIDLLRTAASWRLKPRHRSMRGYSSTLVRGIVAFALGQFGPPPARL